MVDSTKFGEIPHELLATVAVRSSQRMETPMGTNGDEWVKLCEIATRVGNNQGLRKIPKFKLIPRLFRSRERLLLMLVMVVAIQATLWILSMAQQRFQGSRCALDTRLIQELKLPTDELSVTALSLDGRTLAVVLKGSDPYVVQFWDTVSHAMLASYLVRAAPFAQFSPHLTYAIIGDAWVLNFRTLKQWSVLKTGLDLVVGWSPDETMMAWADNGRIVIHESVSGEMVRNWTILAGFKTLGLCWASNTLITVVGYGHNFTGILRYFSNGSLASSRWVQVNDAHSTQELSCNSEGVIALAWPSRTGGTPALQLIPLIGNDIVLKQQYGQVFLGVNMVAVCTDPSYLPQTCKLYDTAFQVMLEVTETLGHLLLGLSPDDSQLVTYYAGRVFRWNVRTPSARVLFTPPLWSTQQHSWIDRDNVLVHSATMSEQINVRTGHHQEAFVPSYAWRYCVMQGEIYVATQNDTRMTISVFVQGSEVRRWSLPEGFSFDNLQCSTEGSVLGAFAWNSSTLRYWLVWTRFGSLIQNILVKDWANVYVLAMFNISLFACVTSGWDLQFWNLETLTWNPPVYHGARSLQWSPNGHWLSIETVYGVMIFNSSRIAVMEIEFVKSGGSGSWSPDSNWLLLPTSPPSLACPMLGKTWLLDGFSAGGVWNPQTMEILSVNDKFFKIWVPMPSLIGLIASNQTGVLFPATVRVLGGIFLPSMVKAMVSWVDSSTAVVQCMFFNATVVDTFTLALGPLALPDPAIYTVHIECSTLHSTSPWLSSSSNFAAMCGGPTRPIFNLTGGVTRCECLATYYTVPNVNVSEVQCRDCPDHARCDGSTLVKSEPGYWPQTENPYHFLPCAAGACPGENQCSPCYEGPRCGLCSWNLEQKCGQHGFGRCRECKPVWQDITLIIAGVMCWAIFCTLQSMFALGWRNSKSGGNNSGQLIATIVSTTQMNALLLSVNVKLQSLSLGYLEENTQAGGIQAAILSCVLLHYGVHPGHVHFVKQVVMLLLPLIGYIVSLAFRCCRRTTTSADTVRVPIIVLWSSLQSAVTTSLFQTLWCDDVQSQEFKYRLSHDRSVPCFGNTYWTFIGIVTIPALILTVLVIPLRFAWLLRFRPSGSDSGHLRFLVKSYRKDWWYLVVFYRKVLLSIVVTFTKNPFHVASTLLVSGFLHLLTWPSTSFLVNTSEACSLMGSVFIFGVAGAVGVQSQSNLGTLELLSVGGLSYIIQIGLLFYDRWHSTSSKHDDNISTVVMQQVDQDHYDHLLDK